MLCNNLSMPVVIEPLCIQYAGMSYDPNVLCVLLNPFFTHLCHTYIHLNHSSYSLHLYVCSDTPHCIPIPSHHTLIHIPSPLLTFPPPSPPHPFTHTHSHPLPFPPHTHTTHTYVHTAHTYFPPPPSPPHPLTHTHTHSPTSSSSLPVQSYPSLSLWRVTTRPLFTCSSRILQIPQCTSQSPLPYQPSILSTNSTARSTLLLTE